MIAGQRSNLYEFSSAPASTMSNQFDHAKCVKTLRWLPDKERIPQRSGPHRVQSIQSCKVRQDSSMYDHLSINDYIPVEAPAINNSHMRRTFDHGIERSELLERELSSPIEPSESWPCWLYLSQLWSSTKFTDPKNHITYSSGRGLKGSSSLGRKGQARVPAVEKRICLFPIYSNKSRAPPRR